jgi:hypothetical protein
VYSKHEGKEFGSFVRTAGKFFNDEKEDKGKKHIFIDNCLKNLVAFQLFFLLTYVSFPLTNTWKRHVRERMFVAMFIAFFNHVCQSPSETSGRKIAVANLNELFRSNLSHFWSLNRSSDIARRPLLCPLPQIFTFLKQR